MKTIGTVINTIVVVFGMLCSLIAGAFVGYSLTKGTSTSRTRVDYGRPWRSYGDYNREYVNGRRAGYKEGWDECKMAYGVSKEEETENNEDIGEA